MRPNSTRSNRSGRTSSAHSLANLTKHNITELTTLVKTRLRRMQYRPGVLEGFLAKTGLDLTPM
jgi:hypothetical protein